jgi:hypothetical protein
VVAEMKLTVRHLKSSVDSLQEHLRFNHSSLRSGRRQKSLLLGCEEVKSVLQIRIRDPVPFLTPGSRIRDEHPGSATRVS